jgi:energy-converting hydrogenase A subunit M
MYGAGIHCNLLYLDKQRLRKPQEKLGELISIIKAEYRDILINKQDCSELYGDTHNKRKEARFTLKPAQ